MTNPLSGMTPAVQIDLPQGCYLRSVTINPVLGDIEDGKSSAFRIFIHMFLLAIGKRVPPKVEAVVWIEFQIGSVTIKRHRVPDFKMRLSSALVPKDGLDETALRRELSRSVSLVNSVTFEVDQDDLEAAYGIGAKPSAASSRRHGDNINFVAIKRPYYRKAEDGDIKTCYFAVGVCGKIGDHEGRPEVTISPLPIHSRSRCPVPERMTMGRQDTVAIWLPIHYPSAATDLTFDDRRYLNLKVIWPRVEDRNPEVLSFPRVSRRFRLVQSTPAYQVSPSLERDPAPWRAGAAGAFALDASPIVPARSTNYESCGLSFIFEDMEEVRTLLLGQIFISILAGVIAGTLASLVFESSTGIQPWQRIFAVVLAFVVSVGGVLLLLPRTRSV